MGTGTWRVGPPTARPRFRHRVRPRTAAAPPLTAASREPVPGRLPSPRSLLQERASDLESRLGERPLRLQGRGVGDFQPLNPDATELAGPACDAVAGVLGTECPEVAFEVEFDAELSRRPLALGEPERVR